MLVARPGLWILTVYTLDLEYESKAAHSIRLDLFTLFFLPRMVGRARWVICDFFLFSICDLIEYYFILRETCYCATYALSVCVWVV